MCMYWDWDFSYTWKIVVNLRIEKKNLPSTTENKDKIFCEHLCGGGHFGQKKKWKKKNDKKQNEKNIEQILETNRRMHTTLSMYSPLTRWYQGGCLALR